MILMKMFAILLRLLIAHLCKNGTVHAGFSPATLRRCYANRILSLGFGYPPGVTEPEVPHEALIFALT